MTTPKDLTGTGRRTTYNSIPSAVTRGSDGVVVDGTGTENSSLLSSLALWLSSNQRSNRRTNGNGENRVLGHRQDLYRQAPENESVYEILKEVERLVHEIDENELMSSLNHRSNGSCQIIKNNMKTPNDSGDESLSNDLNESVSRSSQTTSGRPRSSCDKTSSIPEEEN